jgi:hypothetical protein
MSDNPFEDPSVAASSSGMPAPDWLENDNETEMVMVSFGIRACPGVACLAAL